MAPRQCSSVEMWPPGSVARSSSANERPALLRQSPLSFSPLLLLAAKLFVCNRSYLYVENIKMMSGSLNKSSSLLLLAAERFVHNLFTLIKKAQAPLSSMLVRARI